MGSWISGSWRSWVHGLHQPSVHFYMLFPNTTLPCQLPSPGVPDSNHVSWVEKKPSSLGGPSHPPPLLRLCQRETSFVDALVEDFFSFVKHYASSWPLVEALAT